MTSPFLDRFGNTIPEWYVGYVKSIGDRSLSDALEHNSETVTNLIRESTPSTLLFAYADGKWTVAEVLLHIIDSERIFTYRALRIARGDATPLPGFDENMYVPNSGASGRSASSLLDEYIAVRKSTITFFRNLVPEALQRRGTANGHLFSVEMIGTIIAGHELHHLEILKSRYGL